MGLSTLRDKKVLAVVLVEILSEESRKKRNRSIWMRDWLKKRSQLSCYHGIMRELMLQDRQCYRTILRMTPSTFEEVLTIIGPAIKKKTTNMRQPIPEGERLALTLRFLCTGLSFSPLAFDFFIGRQTISQIVIETCNILYEKLGHIYLKVPSTSEDWLKIAAGFYNSWNFPNCIGAIDGKHVLIEAKENSGSIFYNYKGDFSIVLMALVDSDYKFIFVDIGRNGRVSDGGIYARSVLKEVLEKNLLDIPPPIALPGSDVTSPYTIVGDSAFPLKTFLMKPYPLQVSSFRLSRARRVVENAFGILAKRWEIFRSPIRVEPVKASIIVRAACLLHNYLQVRCKQIYLEDDVEDVSSALVPLGQLGTNNFTQEASIIRERFMHYFNGIGSVPWNDRTLSLVV